MFNTVRTNSLTSVRLGYSLGYISVWVTPPNRLTFWDGAHNLISGIRARFVMTDEEKIRVKRFNSANFEF